MPFIVITVQDDGSGISISVNPRQATAVSNARNFTWVLMSGSSGWNWPPDSTGLAGIVLSTDPPPGTIYSPWPPGTPPAQPGIDNSYTATAPDIPSNVPAVFYKYTVNLVNSSNGQTMRIDPDIANDPAG